jgi:hypothetical protein
MFIPTDIFNIIIDYLDIYNIIICECGRQLKILKYKI